LLAQWRCWYFLPVLHIRLLPPPQRTGTYIGGHGGIVGQSVGGYCFGAMGKFLSALVFFLLSVFAFLFAFGIEPKVFLALTECLAVNQETARTKKT
jgi:hypothetical protein